MINQAEHYGNPKLKQLGFTIIEMMIATTVFSVILLVCLSALVYVGRLYYKGVAINQTQGAARDVVDSIGDAVKFSSEKTAYSSTPNGDWDGYVCVGSKKYSYKINKVLVKGTLANSNQTSEVLVESVDPNCGTGSTAHEPYEPNKTLYPHREILGQYMRLTEFSVSRNTTSGLVSISVSIVYGGDGTAADDELFTIDTGVIVACKTGVPGGEFCAYSSLSKTVYGIQ